MDRRRRLALAAGAALSLAAPSTRAQRARWLHPPRDRAERDRELAARFPDVPLVDDATLADELARPAPLLRLEARTSAEPAGRRLPGARPAFDEAGVAAAFADAPAAAPVVAYRSIGLRSARLARRLVADGRAPRNLRHGLFGWADAGRPLVDDRGPARLVHPCHAGWGRLLSEARRAPLETR